MVVMNKTMVSLGLGSILGVALACGSESAPSNPVSYGGSSGAGAPGTGGESGSTGVGGGGVAGVAGIGGGGIDFDSGSSRDAMNPDAACEGINRGVETQPVPVDIIWGVDTSGSMNDEAAAVQENINAFSQQIVAAKIDVHVVMISAYQQCEPAIPIIRPNPVCRPGICVGAPLGTGQCPADSKPPTFFHHPQAQVDSQDGAVVFVNRFPEYRQMLRPNSLKYLVIVTDDDSTGGDAQVYADNPDKFIADYTALDPMMRDANGAPTWKMAGIYAHNGRDNGCPNAARVGTFWKGVIDKTGGVHGDICACPAGQQAACTQTFKTVFDALAKSIVTAATPLDCEYPIPARPCGKDLRQREGERRSDEQRHDREHRLGHRRRGVPSRARRLVLRQQRHPDANSHLPQELRKDQGHDQRQRERRVRLREEADPGGSVAGAKPQPTRRCESWKARSRSALETITHEKNRRDRRVRLQAGMRRQNLDGRRPNAVRKT